MSPAAKDVADHVSAALSDRSFQPLWQEISGPTGLPSSGLNTPQLSVIGEPAPQGARGTSTPNSLDALMEPEVATLMRQMSPEGSPNLSRAAAQEDLSAIADKDASNASSNNSKMSGHANNTADNARVTSRSDEAPEADQTVEGPGQANVSRRLSSRAKTKFIPYQHM